MAQIPDKLYFKIGEVAGVTKVKPHVLRYWESEFKIITPRKSVARQRVYTRKDIELILEIKRLLYKEKYTLEGAKKRVKELRNKSPQMDLSLSGDKFQGSLKSMRKELASLKKLLKD
ncbi:MAG: MerR family transcriptional regulator [Thermodesulfobacteriota bacterium]